jgi:P27 family predicted phage terminase small subunit
VWRRIAPELGRRGLLSALDVEMLRQLCELVALADRSRELLGPALVVKGRRDALVTNPAWRIYRDALSQIRLLAQEFGLTPSARSRIRMDILSTSDDAVLDRGPAPPSA